MWAGTDREGVATMLEYFTDGVTLPEAYHDALYALKAFGESTPCEDYNTTQIETSITMLVAEPLKEPMISRLFIGGPRELEQYRQEMLDGILDFEVDKGNWSYTYHSRMAEQLPKVIAELRRNPSTRRAVIDVRDWKHDIESDSPACLQHIQYFIRDGELHCKVLFRSNDAVKATFMNAFALIMLQKKVADELGVEMGTYTHRANSFHCYEKDIPLLQGYTDRILSCKDLTYRYVGEWDELMAEKAADIAKTVRELKGADNGC